MTNRRNTLSKRHAGIIIAALAATTTLATAQDDRMRPPSQRPDQSSMPTLFPLTELRTFDGSGNNVQHPQWGVASSAFHRFAANAYADGANTPSGGNRPGPREVSNIVCAQAESMPNRQGVSDFVWQWGQFLDHDLTLTGSATPAESFNISIPTGDIFFDPASTGTQIMPFSRSQYTTASGVRQQVNSITTWIDASMVYGSDAARATALRTMDGTGRLKTSEGNLLPFNEDGLVNAPTPFDPTFFVAGDIRVNEQVGLMAIQTLFVREHNYWADRIRNIGHRTAPGGGTGGNPPHPPGPLTDNQIYEYARAIVTAEIQAISYREFLPALLGPGALHPYNGYHQNVNPTISNEFATAAYRFGHSMLSPTLKRLDRNGNTIAAGDLTLAGSFFNVPAIVDDGIDPVIRGLARQRAQELDNFVIDDVRNFLFGPPGAGGFDLASLNIQRGRDHGFPSFSKVREAYGLPPVTSFEQISHNPAVRDRLVAAYGTIDKVDPWIGMLSEDDIPGALVGETLFVILTEQFEALRDGDRFWYQRTMPREWIMLIENQTLSTIIRRNTSIRGEIGNNAFRVPAPPPSRPLPIRAAATTG